MTNKDISPLFTVIIPTKDRAEYLHHTLRTCTMQSYDNLEVIVSDDGSTDNSEEIAIANTICMILSSWFFKI